VDGARQGHLPVYSSQMDGEAAGTLAAQVVNFLKGEDIDERARVSDEPLRSWIMTILPQVRQRAAECMQADRQTREIIVATLRMNTVLMFGKYGIAWFQNPAKMRIEQDPPTARLNSHPLPATANTPRGGGRLPLRPKRAALQAAQASAPDAHLPDNPR
jgi:hypothetical protein